ncbi:hypothetical protein BDN72DRAFT_844395 [Pluteus cervinus]|uniref:Uncharacterized protein n=1 Tax=Pluteus cervinus TaxID=181527 RepID=A0ACD3AMC4_9AGAR|nr:hypothetical protein BDN72DRAFT_844395 [Pluteus cervinus]
MALTDLGNALAGPSGPSLLFDNFHPAAVMGVAPLAGGNPQTAEQQNEGRWAMVEIEIPADAPKWFIKLLKDQWKDEYAEYLKTGAKDVLKFRDWDKANEIEDFPTLADDIDDSDAHTNDQNSSENQDDGSLPPDPAASLLMSGSSTTGQHSIDDGADVETANDTSSAGQPVASTSTVFPNSDGTLPAADPAPSSPPPPTPRPGTVSLPSSTTSSPVGSTFPNNYSAPDPQLPPPAGQFYGVSNSGPLSPLASVGLGTFSSPDVSFSRSRLFGAGPSSPASSGSRPRSTKPARSSSLKTILSEAPASVRSRRNIARSILQWDAELFGGRGALPAIVILLMSLFFPVLLAFVVWYLRLIVEMIGLA